MTAENNALDDALEQVVEQTLDAFVYAPIGLLFDGPARLPDLVRNGRNQVTNARMMGQFAVQMGRNEVTKRVSEVDGPVRDVLRSVGLVPGATPTPTPTAATTPSDDTPETTATAAATAAGAVAKAAPTKSAKKAAKKAAAARGRVAKKAASNAAAAAEAAAERTAATDTATPAASALPIPDYDSLSASQVVSRLRGLSAGELDAVRAYESATRGRKTILNRVQQLRKQ